MPPLLVSLVVSACLGALVGLIRQWSDQASPEGEVDLGGVRTYTFWAMLGCLGAFGAKTLTPWLLVVTVGLVGAHQIVAMAKSAAARRPGGTTFASALLTLFVGALIFWQQRQVAIVVAATTMVMLGIKQRLHTLTRTFTADDIRATLQFVAITGVMLPLVPDADYGPFGGFNPYSTWLMVVLISGVGFAGYIAVRIIGEGAGTLLTSFLGGIASSTATTLAFSRRSKEQPAESDVAALAVVIACSVMLPRVIATVAVFDTELARALIAPFGAMAIPGVLYGLWFWLTHRHDAPAVSPTLHNPLNLFTAIKFALIYAVIAFLVKAVSHLGNQTGLLPLSFVSGLTDMDAISLSMARNRDVQTVTVTLAAKAIVLAAVANSLLKAGLAISLGSPALRRRVAAVLGLTAVTGIAGVWLVS